MEAAHRGSVAPDRLGMHHPKLVLFTFRIEHHELVAVAVVGNRTIHGHHQEVVDVWRFGELNPGEPAICSLDDDYALPAPELATNPTVPDWHYGVARARDADTL